MDRPLCPCGRPREKAGKGEGFRPTCWRCRRPDRDWSSSWAKRKRRAYKAAGLVCRRCGFVPEDPCQVDVDHRDGDRENNDPENLDVLCANCHRLKTKEAGDHLRPPYTIPG